MASARCIMVLGLVAGSLMAGPGWAKTPAELGDIAWMRNFEQAKATAVRTGRPLLVLFDEVPGCQTCVRYGQAVLSHPLIVEAAETEFVPVAVYNNVPGPDREVLRRFGEPTWNNPVVRIVDAEFQALSPRVNGDYSQAGLLRAMTSALRKAGRSVPSYLALLEEQVAGPKAATAHYSMYCFWSGEVCLGELPGVRSTRAGFAEGKEVVEVHYDPTQVTRARLDATAKACGAPLATHSFRGSAKDDKYQLKHSPLKAVPMTRLQSTRVNARLGKRQDPLALLSARQRELYAAALRRKLSLDLTQERDLRVAFRLARSALLSDR